MNIKLKKEIEQKFKYGKLEDVELLLEQYKQVHLKDRDLWFYECILAMMQGRLDDAQKIADRCVEKFPTCCEAYYYQASVYQMRNMIMESLKGYHTTVVLNRYTKYLKQEI